MDIDEVLSMLRSRRNGLSSREAEQRIEESGANILEKKRGISAVRVFLAQFQDFMVVVLLGATLISCLMGELSDAFAISAIVLLNALLGYFQEMKAERSIEALKELNSPTSNVMRDGKVTSIHTGELVPGDIAIIEAGSRVPADGRIIEADGLEIDEATLTGESIPCSKTSAILSESHLQPGDKKNMVFMSTLVTRGRGLFVVTKTGMNTEVGKIAGMLDGDSFDVDTPLQARLSQLGRWLVALCLGMTFIIVVVGIMQGEPIRKMFFIGVTLAVAAIPEGLPAIVTISLAIGVQRMVRKNAVIRKLAAVETLGCTTVICSDKTGTLTQNQMTVRSIYTGNALYDVSGSGYNTVGEFFSNGRQVRPEKDYGLMQVLKLFVLCNDAHLDREAQGVLGRLRDMLSGRTKTRSAYGDPTETALLVTAAKADIFHENLAQQHVRILTLPFDSMRKMMTTVCTDPHTNYLVCSKGAPDVLINRCRFIQLGNKTVHLDRRMRKRVEEVIEGMAEQAYRVLAVAYKYSETIPEDNLSSLESNLVLAGLVGMIDPPREEVPAAIEVARRAGIRTIMITGDHKTTAVAIGKMIGVCQNDTQALSGTELDALSDAELETVLQHVSIFARVSPKHKLRIVEILRQSGEIVAMTGDGVNDAPAVKEADIGIAMGKIGTDVTREASSMVLLDDNYATIVAAIEEGRGIYDNIRKFIRYLLSCNIGELLTMLLSMLIGLPIPLVPLQILWVNLVTDGLPAIALGVDPKDDDTMERPPRNANEGIFSGGLHVRILAQGIAIGVCTVSAFVLGLYFSRNLEASRTIAFTTLTFSQLLFVFLCRSEEVDSVQSNLLGNPWLIGAVGISALLQLGAIYIPQLNVVFNTAYMHAGDWYIIGMCSIASVVIPMTIRLAMFGLSTTRISRMPMSEGETKVY
jgi:Ca2+-transporting ATPase